MSKILIIDGNSLINRAYFAIPSLSNKKGVPTNAVYGFVNMIMKLISDNKPTHVSVAFDLKGPTFRHEEYGDYKGHRKGMDDDLRVQFPMIKNVLDALGIHRAELQGYEADDLIGTMARICESEGFEVIIVTGDKDALQLSSELTRVMLTKRGITNMKEYKPSDVFEEYGLMPYQIPDYKGLSGDASDNIKGLPGVGHKTAIKFLEEFETVEKLVENAESISSPRLRSIVQENCETALMSKRLATIHVSVPIEFDVDEFMVGRQDSARLVELLNEYELKSLLKHVDARGVAQAEKAERVEKDVKMPSVGESDQMTMFNDAGQGLESDYMEVWSAPVDGSIGYAPSEALKPGAVDMRIVSASEESSSWESAISSIPDGSEAGVKVVFDKVSLRSDKVRGMALSLADEDIYMDFGAVEGNDVFRRAVDALVAKKVTFVGHDIKNEMLSFIMAGAQVPASIFDTQIGEYLLDPERTKYMIEDIAMEYSVGFRPMSSEDLLGKGAKKISFAGCSVENLAKYGTEQARASLLASLPIRRKLESEGLAELMNKVELPLVEVLASIEYDGFSVDRDVLGDLGEELSEKLDEMTGTIYDMAGCQFNINSPKQLGEILFETLDLPAQKKTKTGYSTSVDVLEKLKEAHPIIPLIMEYRTYSKLKSTYIDGLTDVINEETGRIHTSLNQTVTATGRLSSSEPNLQNIPVRIPLGRRLRKIFRSSGSNVLVDADYSQIELRILAELSGDDVMIRAFMDDDDIHTITASQVFDTPVDMVTSAERSRAKAVNFGIVYGQSDFGLSETLGIPVKTAKAYIEQYFRKYPKIKSFLDGSVDFCKREGYVKTILGRKRYVHDINSKNFNLRSFAQRIAMNTPIQGSAADIMKLAMIKVYYEMKEKGMKSRLILQVHDELIIDAHPEELEEIKELLKRNMDGALDGFVEFKVPLVSSMSVGTDWFDAK